MAVLIRDKLASAAELLATVVAAAEAIDAHAAAHPSARRPLLLVDDRVDVGLAALARGVRVDGVHVGQSDVPADLVRRMLYAASPDRRLVVGLTANTPAHVEAVRALPAGTVDYLGVGVIRPTSTKPDHPAPLGHDGFGIIAGLSPVPCVAIGGVDVRDVAAIAAAGGAGTAVVSAICAGEDPGAAARELAEAWARVRAAAGDATAAEDDASARALRPVPRVLSIAGTDPTGGAGIQADLKSIAANGGYGMAVVTALVAQNTSGVREIHVPPVAFLPAQLDAVSDDVAIDAVKIGMLGSAAVVDEVADWLRAVRPPVVVLEPVMVAQSGDALLDADATEALRRLLPLADVVTPNLPELAALLGEREADGWDEALAQGRTLAVRHGVRVVVKGGHLRVDDCPDALVTPGAAGAEAAVHVVDGPRITTTSTHGTGCSLSSALATLHPRRGDWLSALTEAKAWLTGSLAHAEDLEVGSGAGPLDHLRALWDAAGTHAEPISAEMWAGSADLRREIDDLPFVRPSATARSRRRGSRTTSRRTRSTSGPTRACSRVRASSRRRPTHRWCGRGPRRTRSPPSRRCTRSGCPGIPRPRSQGRSRAPTSTTCSRTPRPPRRATTRCSSRRCCPASPSTRTWAPGSGRRDPRRPPRARPTRTRRGWRRTRIRGSRRPRGARASWSTRPR